MKKLNILPDGSVEGQTFSGEKYRGEYPHPLENKETYKEFYNRVEECKSKGFHLGDLNWNDWYSYCLGSPAGGGQSVSNYKIGTVPNNRWISDND
jgi:hypothetical protein